MAGCPLKVRLDECIVAFWSGNAILQQTWVELKLFVVMVTIS